jgi:hypothetical protein
MTKHQQLLLAAPLLALAFVAGCGGKDAETQLGAQWARQMIEDAPRQQANYDAALAHATNHIPYAAEFARLFPGSASYFSYYTGVVGPSRFVMESLLFQRYQLTMIVPVTFDETRRKVTTFGEPQLTLRELDATPRRFTGKEHSPNFGAPEWKKLVEARGDLSALGFTILTNSPAPGFEEFRKNWEMRNTKQP